MFVVHICVKTILASVNIYNTNANDIKFKVH
jgi:hypothetical protein